MVNVYFYSFLPALPYYLLQTASYLLSLAGQLGFVVFALRFPDNRSTSWRSRHERAVPYIFTCGLLYIASVYALDMYGIVNGSPIEVLQFLPFIPLYVWAWYVLIRSYAESNTADRRRLRWAIGGTMAASVLALGAYGIEFVFPEWLADTTYAIAELTIALTIAYAIVRHQLFDVQFIANRTILFACLSAAAAALFATLDWVSANVLPHSQLVTAAALAVTFLLGYVVSRSLRNLIRFIDGAFFPKRRAAMDALSDLRVALEQDVGETFVQQTLTTKVCDVLRLASAAVFRSMPDGGYAREAALGWAPRSAWHLLPDDAIVQHLERFGRKALHGADLPWDGLPIPTDTARPIFGVPVRWRHEITAIALFGSHTNGSDIDPDEVRALVELCGAAAPALQAAYAEAG